MPVPGLCRFEKCGVLDLIVVLRRGTRVSCVGYEAAKATHRRREPDAVQDGGQKCTPHHVAGPPRQYNNILIEIGLNDMSTAPKRRTKNIRHVCARRARTRHVALTTTLWALLFAES